MSIFNDAARDALLSGRYICSNCGERMEFEDENEDVLICPKCGHSVELERYGCEDDEDYDNLYPTKEEVMLLFGEDADCDDEDDYEGETYSDDDEWELYNVDD